MKTLNCDVCILGAGPGGATAALFLDKAGIPCTIVDKGIFPRDKICGDALSGKVFSVLKKLDPSLIDRLAGQEVALGSWGVSFFAPNGKCIRVPFKSNGNKAERAPGYIVKRYDFDNFLIEEVKKKKNINLLEGTRVDAIERTPDGFIVSDEQGSVHITTRYLLVADGAQSVFNRRCLQTAPDPRHHCAGVRAYYHGVEGLDKDNFIELHFLKEALPGYLWIFPMANGQANVGLGMRSDKISKKKVNLRQQLDALIADLPQLNQRFKNATRIGDVKGFGLPLGSLRRNISGDRYMLIGDAGSLIDPFTGEGISNAMISGMHAADVLSESLRSSDPSSAILKKYDEKVYHRLGKELEISSKLQQLVDYPFLFNFFANRVDRNPELAEMLSAMFDDVDLRKKFKSPAFYVRLLKYF